MIMSERKRNQKQLYINGQFITPRKVCTNCNAIIPIDKGLCGDCFKLKLMGKKVRMKHKNDFSN